MLQLMWIFLDIILFFTSILVWVSIEDEYPLKYGVLASFLFLTFILLLVARRKIAYNLKTKTFKNYSRELITILLVSCIIAFINFLGVKRNFQADLTQVQIHTLSEQTKNILSQFPDEIHIKMLASRGNWNKYREILDQYKHFNSKVHFDFLDINTHPELVARYDVRIEGSAIISYQDKEVFGVANSELKLTNLLIKLSRSKQYLLCYDEGHKELSFKDDSKEGLSFIESQLLNSLYVLRRVDLLTDMMIPQECDLFMILGPRQAFLDAELSKVQDYLDKSGNLLVTLAPVFGENQLKNLFDLLSKNGIRITNSVVIDRLASVQGSQATIPLINDFNKNHPVTKNMNERVIFPLSTNISFSEQDEMRYSYLARTSPFPASWAELSLDEISGGRAQYDLDRDMAGPIDVFGSVENLKTYSRIAVSGSSSFFINGYQGNASNLNLFLNTVAWLIDDTGLISLNRPELHQERVFVSEGQMNLILILSLGVIPLVLFVIAFYMYRRRSKH